MKPNVWCKPVISALGATWRQGDQELTVTLSCITRRNLRVPPGIPETNNSISRMKEQEGEALVHVSNRLVKGPEDTCMHKQELLLFTRMLALVLSSHLSLLGEYLKKSVAQTKRASKIEVKKARVGCGGSCL